MALTMLDKTPVAAAKTAWPPEIRVSVIEGAR